MRFGPDLSNYQAQFSLEDAVKLAAKQCTFAFIGRQKNNGWAKQQRDYLRAAGIENIGEYLISLRGEWPTLFPETKYVAVDVEPGSEFVDESSIDSAITWIIQQGRVPLIYSSAWAWHALGLDALTKYGEQRVLLWNAYYDGVTNGFDLPTPFGGWTRCVLDQYTAAWDDGGLGYPLDMNDADDTLFGPAPEPAPAPAVDPRIVQIRDLAQAMIDGR